MSADFPTVHTIGGLLPPDLLQRVAAGDAELGGLAPQDYGLSARERIGEAAARAWARAKGYWAAFRAATQDLPEAESGVTQTRQQWLLPLLRELGYGEPEFRAAAEEVDGRRYLISYRAGPVPLHLVGFRQSLDQAVPAAAGQRRLSPHALLQDYLNRADALYGIVSNGRQLRLLRDNASLTRQAYLEFDLEAMLEGGVYADFVLLFLVLHRSRLPQAGAEAGACWLEQWRAKAETQGTRALGALRDGVAAAIQALGTGFLAHPANDALRWRLASGELSVAGFYQQLLRLIYRLLFLFVAEERDLLFPPDAAPDDRRRYREHYSASRLRDLARRSLTDDRHDDLWRGLRVTFDLLAGRRQGLSVPALGGGLFDAESCPDLDAALVRNDALAEAIRRLSWVRVGRVTRRVNYRDMDVEELGGVYEGLLEHQPQLVAEAANPRFELAGGGQRKQTGSYYTPEPLVKELVHSALEPVLAARLRGARTPEQRRQAILNLTVCDPACGSGHFLLAAARHLAGELARIEAGDAEPSPAQLRAALRQVIRHCLYGVDVSPLAVDLCKLALWLEGHDPGRPLTFLDHHIKVGNSLIGATPELVERGIPDDAYAPVTGDERTIAAGLRQRNRQEREGQLRLGGLDGERWAELRDRLGLEVLQIDDLPDEALPQVAEQRARYDAFDRQQLHPARLPLDLWTAAFFWPLRREAPPAPTSADLFAALRHGPDRAALSQAQQRMLEELRERYRFFHWQLEFPEVFAGGGFDCVLGNPPWDKLEMDEQEFFRERDPMIATLAGVRRKQAIAALVQSNGQLWRQFQEQARRTAATSKFVRHSNRFVLTGSGRINLYALFAEHDRAILHPRGRAGIVVPTGIATDDTTKRFFQDLVEKRVLVSYFGFKNEQHLFPLPVEHTVTFGLLTMLGPGLQSQTMEFTWFAYNTDHMSNPARRVVLTAADLMLLNPNTRTCPIFRTREDAELTKAIYRRVPVLVDERAGTNPWGVEFLQGLFNMTSDSHLFHDEPGPGRVPLYEAKLFHQFNHRWATYDGKDAREATPAELANPSWTVRPRYWVDRHEVEARLAGRWERDWLIAHRRIVRATDSRTLIAALLPRYAVPDGGTLLLPRQTCSCTMLAAFFANLNALTVDTIARQKVGGIHLDFHHLRQLPVLPASAYTTADLAFIVPRVLELTYTAWDLQPFARDLGYDGPPFRWDEERRARLRAELDAYYAALYGLNRDELRYLLDPQDVHGPDFPGETFRVLKERETRQYGEYRTRRLVLEAWDRLGLQPRCRDGRYAIEPPSARITTSPPPLAAAAQARGGGAAPSVSSPR